MAEVHRAKRVPPARRPTAAQTGRAWSWPPTRPGRPRYADRLGDWLLRAADGWTGRANSALPVGDPDRPLDGAVDAVERWYADRGQPAMINVPLPLGRAGRREPGRSAAGAPAPPVLVQTAPLAAVRQALGGPVPARSSDGTAPDPVSPPTGTHPPRWRRSTRGRPRTGWTSPPGGEGRLPDAARHVLAAVAAGPLRHHPRTPPAEADRRRRAARSPARAVGSG